MHRILVVVFILLLTAVTGCAAAADASPPEPPLAPVGPVVFSEAVARGLLAFEARGAGTRGVQLVLHARADLDVTIPAGTFFESKTDVQHMVVTESRTVRLRAGASTTLDVATACASYHRPVPGASDGFALGTATPPLAALVTCLERRDVPASRRQVLVWQVTDGVHRDELARDPDRLRPYLVEACTTKLHQSPVRCTRLVDRAFDVALERWLSREHDAERACLRVSAAAR